MLKRFKNILIVNYGNLGDIACALLVNQNIKNVFPEKKIFSIVSVMNYSLLDFDCSVDKYFVYHNGFKNNDIVLMKELKIDCIIFLREITKQPYSTIYKTLKMIFPEAKFIGMLRESDNALGFDYCYVEKEKNISVIEQLKNFVRYLTGKDKVVMPYLDTKNLTPVFNFKTNRPIIYLNLSAGHKRKFLNYLRRNLPVHHYKQIIENLIKDFNVVCTASPEDKKKVYFIKQVFPDNLHLALPETRTFNELLSVINFSDIVITPETSIIHITSLLNKPIIGIYTSKKRADLWTPFSDNYVSILPKIDGLIETVEIEKVVAAVRSFNFIK